MLDPLPSPPSFLASLTAPLAEKLHLSTLPLHIHEILGAFVAYHLIGTLFAPWISNLLFPKYYVNFDARTKVNWNIRVVSLVQSTFINSLALYLMYTDEERKNMDWEGRVYGYTGAGGMLQGFAAGYFLWDLCVCITNVSVFGPGLLAHAIAALTVFSFGFRPFVNFYGPTFILYELSTPFLNFHWFFDKVNMTGSRAQLYNGLLLLFTFFSCRLVWGTIQSVRVYQDVWAALQAKPGSFTFNDKNATATLEASTDPVSELYRFTENDPTVPIWLACTYLGSNVVLNTLNFYWFGKMIETVKKRFQPGAAGKNKKKQGKLVSEFAGVDVDGLVKGELDVDEKTRGKQSVEVNKVEVRRRRG